MNATELKLNASTLDSAINFIDQNDYSLFFPRPFELDAIKHSWEQIRVALSRINLLSFDYQPRLQVIAPKARWAVRPIQLISPVDLIMLTGIVLQYAPALEAKRCKITKKSVFSFRWSKVAGQDQIDSNWDGFVSEIRAKSKTFSYIAKADIVDFYPRIYLHRLESALASSLGDAGIARGIMRPLNCYASGTSYGIPVGPSICSFLAEILLNEVDEYLTSEKINFCRFADDYYIFSDSESESIRALHKLAERLHNTQGLSLNMAKTEVLKSGAMLDKYFEPKGSESKFQKKINKIIFGGNPYMKVDYHNLSAPNKRLVNQLRADIMLRTALESDVTDYDNVKFVLNFLSALSQPKLANIIIKHLGKLQPVSQQVSKYFDVFDKIASSEKKQYGKRIMKYVRTSPFANDYQVIWLLQPFVEAGTWNCLDDLRTLAREDKNCFIRRQAALAVAQIGDRSAILDLKSTINDARDWEWRAIVFACRKLPADEREAFWRSLRIANDWSHGNILQKATLEYSRWAATNLASSPRP